MRKLAKLRYKSIRAIFKKEIIDIFRDKRTLAIMILIPLLLYPLLMLLGSQVSIMVMRSRDAKVFPIAFDFQIDATLNSLVKDQYDEYKLTVVNPLDVEQAFDNGEIMAYITESSKDNRSLYTIHYKSSENDSNTASNRLSRLMNQYKDSLTRDQLNEAGINPEIILEPILLELSNKANDDEQAGMFLGMILPFILIIGLITGAMYPAIDVTSGEKERGTLETLLTLPVTSLELIGGKYLAVSTIAVISALLNFLSIMAAGLFLMYSFATQFGEDNMDFGTNLQSLIPAVLITLVSIIIFALFVSAVILCVTSFAKSFKEAQNYITPVMILFMFPAYVSMIPDVQLTSMTAAIPIVNISLLIREVLMLKYDVFNMAIVLFSNAGYALLAIILLSKIYNSESVLFDSKGEFSLFERRDYIIKGSKVSTSDGLFIYVISALVLFYGSTILITKFSIYGLAFIQFIILIIPLLASVYLKLDFIKTFSLRLPRFKDLFAGLFLWIGAYIIANLSANFILHLFPENQNLLSNLEDVLIGDHFLITLLIVAVLPAICEEFFFRGFILSSLRGSVRDRTAIIAVGLMFGLYHFNFIRIVPTTILGLAFTYSVYKSGSILIPIMMHFLNNAMAVSLYTYPQALDRINAFNNLIKSGSLEIVIYLVIATIFLLAGVHLFKDSGIVKPVNPIEGIDNIEN